MEGEAWAGGSEAADIHIEIEGWTAPLHPRSHHPTNASFKHRIHRRAMKPATHQAIIPPKHHESTVLIVGL
jgi:hypothetical protein